MLEPPFAQLAQRLQHTLAQPSTMYQVLRCQVMWEVAIHDILLPSRQPGDPAAF